MIVQYTINRFYDNNTDLVVLSVHLRSLLESILALAAHVALYSFLGATVLRYRLRSLVGVELSAPANDCLNNSRSRGQQCSLSAGELFPAAVYVEFCQGARFSIACSA